MHPGGFQNHNAGKKWQNGACQASGPSLLSPSFWTPQKAAGGRNVWLAAATREILIMPVRIRLKRVGAKNAPYFRIVVADGRSPRDGKFIEEIGSYQPMKKGDNCKLDLERAKYWVSKGAQPSETVASFIKKLNKAAVAV
jgi:small subunit ribosomal protein S16